MMQVALRVHEPSSIFLIRKGGANALVSLYFLFFDLNSISKLKSLTKK